MGVVCLPLVRGGGGPWFPLVGSGGEPHPCLCHLVGWHCHCAIDMDENISPVENLIFAILTKIHL